MSGSPETPRVTLNGKFYLLLRKLPPQLIETHHLVEFIGGIKPQFLGYKGETIAPASRVINRTYVSLEKGHPTIHPKPSPWNIQWQGRNKKFSDDSQEQHKHREAYQLPLGVSDVCECLVRIQLCDDLPGPRQKRQNVCCINSGANYGEPFWG